MVEHSIKQNSIPTNRSFVHIFDEFVDVLVVDSGIGILEVATHCQHDVVRGVHLSLNNTRQEYNQQDAQLLQRDRAAGCVTVFANAKNFSV